MTTHDLVQAADGIHGIVTGSNSSNANLGPYANAAARLTAGALLGTLSKGSVCQQTDTNQYWMFLGSGAWWRIAGPRSVYSEPTATRTVALTDVDALGLFSNTAGAVYTIPLNATVPLPIGAEVEVCQSAAGQVSFSPFSGSVILQAPSGYLGTKAQNSKAKAVKIATDTWLISGDLAALTSAFSGNFGALLPSCVMYLRSDLGLHVTGSIVNTWDNQIAGGPNVVEGTAGVGICSVGAAVNGHAQVISNGTTQYGKYALSLTNPGTTPIFFYVVIAPLSNTAVAQVLTYSNVAGGPNILRRGSGTDFAATAAGTTFTVAAPISTFGRGYASFTNSAADVVKFGSAAPQGGATMGNQGMPGPNGLFANQDGTQPANFGCLLFMIANATPSSAQIAALDAAVTSFYGSGVAV